MESWRERAERAEARLASITGMARQELARTTAEEQREACAKAAADFYANGLGDPQYAVRFTPLVTEGET